MFKIFSLPTLLLASLAIGVVVSTPLAARDDGYRSATAARTRGASSFRRLASSARTRSVSHRARVALVLGMTSRTNEAEVMRAILDGKRGYFLLSSGALDSRPISLDAPDPFECKGRGTTPGSVEWSNGCWHLKWSKDKTRKPTAGHVTTRELSTSAPGLGSRHNSLRD
ncbi:hypothetical protein B0H14DRAFT_2593732 [Mycena olivaceomarginata]|nr:hypothetical protein B0H14DRAFT_2593732 [Mycena olivaceomarginata]